MAAPCDVKPRYAQGHYTSGKKRRGRPALKKNNNSPAEQIVIDQNYVIGHFHDEIQDKCDLCCPGFSSLQSSAKIKQKRRRGRRVVEWASLLEGPQLCTDCRLVPLLFTPQHVIWEMKMGLVMWPLWFNKQLRMVKHILIIREGVSETPQ